MSRRRASNLPQRAGARARSLPIATTWYSLWRSAAGHDAALPAVSLGDWFCLPVDADDSPVYHWGWILAEAREVAPDLSTFWRGWLGGSTTA